MNSNNNDSNAQQHQVTRGGAGGGLPRLMQGNLQVFLSVEVLLAKVSGRAERQGSVSPPLSLLILRLLQKTVVMRCTDCFARSSLTMLKASRVWGRVLILC